MAYLGNDLQVAFPSYKIIDDISGSFNGVLTSFALQVSGATPVPFPINPQQCLISVNGVVQQPDPTGSSGFNLVGSNIVFASAPTGGHTFFGVILAGADYINVGVNYPSGSASAPSITFDTDLDTGIYNPASNELAITTNSTKRFNINSSGQVEISSAGSSAAPALFFNTDTNTGLYSPGANQVAISTNGTKRLRIDATGYVELSDNDLFLTKTSLGNGQISFDGTSFSLISNSSSASLVLGTNSAESLRIISDGKLGLGTSTPTSLLTVGAGSTANPAADVTIQDSTVDQYRLKLTSNNYNVDTKWLGIGFGYNNSYLKAGIIAEAKDIYARTNLHFCLDGNPNSDNAALSDSKMVITYGGSVGIGTTSPSGNLDVRGLSGTTIIRAVGADTNGNADVEIFSVGTTGNSRLYFADTAAQSGSIIYNHSNNSLAFATNGAARLTIQNDGSVIWGNVYGDTVGATNRDLYIDNTGLMGYVSSIRASKANINDIENTDWLYQLNPVSFNRRKKDENENYTEETYDELEYGLIAEEVETVAPELCFYDDVDGNAELRGVHYTQLITPIVKALQQAATRIETLEAEVAALKGA